MKSMPKAMYGKTRAQKKLCGWRGWAVGNWKNRENEEGQVKGSELSKYKDSTQHAWPHMQLRHDDSYDSHDLALFPT